MSEPYIKVERTGSVRLKKYGTTVLDMTLGEAEELRKQLEEALKDPLEGYGLPWKYNGDDWLAKPNGACPSVPQQGTLARAFASLSEAEQREFLMRGLA